ncbi:MAG: PDZ domain-containing protein [Chitinophagaceae bacterium]
MNTQQLVSLALLSLCWLAPTTYAQEKKDPPPAGEYDVIIIRKKNDRDNKVTVEVKEGKIIVNGKPLTDFEDIDVDIRVRKMPRMRLSSPSSPFRGQDLEDLWDLEEPGTLPEAAPPSAFLGVLMENTSSGVRIREITPHSPAAQAGLQEGDLLTKINQDSVQSANEIRQIIASMAPNEKITITYNRNGKLQTTTAVLEKRKQDPPPSFRFAVPPDPPNQPMDPADRPKDKFRFRKHFDYRWEDDQLPFFPDETPSSPRLGLKVQDNEEGKGVNVIGVEKGTAAERSGLQPGDVILMLEKEAVNNTDELSSLVTRNQDKKALTMTVLRQGKTLSIQIKKPRPLKTANL